MPRIVLHEKALAHLSRGLYRSPASAIRELVSNAWDANAKTVRIDTNYPNFYQVAVTDDGEGFTKDDFQSLMRGGIGNSDKRVGSIPLAHGRPVIGRLGIGMLGIAQICGSFTVASKPANGAPFRARVKLYDLLMQKLDQNDASVVEEKSVPHKDENVLVKQVDVGEYSFESASADELPRSGTQIIADDLHPTFIRSFKDSVKHEQFKEPPLDWTKALQIVSRAQTLQQLGDYWRLLWELSASCPIPYLDDSVLPSKVIAGDQEKLLSYKFRLFVDGIQLFKPVKLRGNKAGYTCHRFEEPRKLIYGRPLSYHGYIVVQEGSQIKPDELRGILIRVKNVGIGGYDQTFLDYRINQGPRSRWATGEVFVDEGLEDALNVDRDSFNKFHPEYREVQERVHAVLSKDIFPEVYRKIDQRSNAAAAKRTEERYEALKGVLTEELAQPVSVKVEPSKVGEAEPPEVRVVEGKTRTSVSLPNPETIKTRKPQRQLASAILAVFEVAMNERTDDKRRAKFTELLLELLAKW